MESIPGYTRKRHVQHQSELCTSEIRGQIQDKPGTFHFDNTAKMNEAKSLINSTIHQFPRGMQCNLLFFIFTHPRMVADMWGQPPLAIIDWNRLLYSFLEKVTYFLGHTKAKIFHSFVDVIPNWEKTGRVSRKDALDFCSKTRTVLQDFNRAEDILDKPDKKAIIGGIPQTIRELLSKNSDIMQRDILPDELFDNILVAVKEFEQAFIITEFHEKLKVGGGSTRHVLQAEVVENSSPTLPLSSYSSATVSDSSSNSEFQQLLARVPRHAAYLTSTTIDFRQIVYSNRSLVISQHCKCLFPIIQ